jgi:hypothetical protein
LKPAVITPEIANQPVREAQPMHGVLFFRPGSTFKEKAAATVRIFASLVQFNDLLAYCQDMLEGERIPLVVPDQQRMTGAVVEDGAAQDLIEIKA